ncbi:beta-alanine-activating enzyme [Rhinophrynus dorsalis]
MESTLHEMVLNAATHHADRNAVCFHANVQPPVFYTYRKVMQLTGELTAFLKSHCYGAENCKVGLYGHPGIHLPSCIMGILQLPAAYCPVDPTAPSHLSASLIERFNLKYMLVEKDKSENFKLLFPDWSEEESSAVQHLGITLFKAGRCDKEVVLPMNDEVNELGKESDKLRERSSTPELADQRKHIDVHDKHCLAYVLHTSGTTGTPKIVSVPHQCIVPNICHLRSIFNISPEDIMFLASPLTFDPSVIEMFLSLSSGACLLIVPDLIKMMPRRLCDLLFCQHRVTVLQVTPTFLRRFGSGSIRSSVLSRETSLRVLALGGEPFPPMSVIRSWREPENKTQIFNLYGVTEVSSWATYYKVPEKVVSLQEGTDSLVPLGIPLHGTVVEVENDEGIKIEEGEGQVLLGGRERICFLDEEERLPCGTMRKTGDWVTLKGGDIFFLGRKDSQIKRNGKRINLEYIQQAVESFAQVEACAVSWFESKQLILFVVPNGSIEMSVLWKELKAHLLSYAVPDDVVLIEALPVTKHGKLDVSRLNAIYTEYTGKKKPAHILRGEEELWDGLQHIWKSTLGLVEESSDIPGDSVFLLSGGDSLMAVRLHEELEILVGKPLPSLVQIILSDTILDIYRHISKALHSDEEQKTEAVSPALANNLNNTKNLERSRKYLGKRKDRAGTSSKKDIHWFISLSKGNQLFSNARLSSEFGNPPCHLLTGSNPELAELLERDYPRSEFKRARNTQHAHAHPCSLSPSIASTVAQTHSLEGPPHDWVLGLQVRWKSDTGKCVDASPLLVKSADRDSLMTVYIGSHSHRMQALDLQTGKVIWERVLGDRIESSAAVSRCGNFVLVGCYDGSLYVLRRSDGETHWIFSTGNAVKSSPSTDPLTGVVFVGSHDQHLYALDINEKRCVWKSHCGGGAVFASPCINTKPHHLYIATLGGLIMAVNPVTGNNIWKYVCGKPVFASPQCSPDHVFVGCVDENFYCLNHVGEKIWHFTTNGPIFSSPCVSNLSKQIMFGSHDGFIYCCNMEGVLVWKYKTRSRVYATSFVFPEPHRENSELLAAASTDGHVYILDAQTGLLNTEHRLGGEIFSSPVVWGSSVIVGCRNNYVYCLDLEAEVMANK